MTLLLIYSVRNSESINYFPVFRLKNPGKEPSEADSRHGGLLIAPHIEGLSYIDTTVISAIVIVFGSFGDLVESMFKRCIEIKDSGHIMPGHGGVLDRLDSILYALPVIFVYIAFKFGC